MNQLAIKAIFFLYSYNIQNCTGRRILSMTNNQEMLCFHDFNLAITVSCVE